MVTDDFESTDMEGSFPHRTGKRPRIEDTELYPCKKSRHKLIPRVESTGGGIETSTYNPRRLLSTDMLKLTYDINAHWPPPITYQPQNVNASNKKNPHIGQLKLQLSEMQLLINTCTKTAPMLCVYVGAAPCIHLIHILRLFPNTFFLLVDPAICLIEQWYHNKDYHRFVKDGRVATVWERFNHRSVGAITSWFDHMSRTPLDRQGRASSCCVPGLGIYDALSTLKLPDTFSYARSGKFDCFTNLLFISDLRRVAKDEMSITRDMEDQQRWFQNMKAHAALLKFRPPFAGEGETYECRYLKGTIFLPIFGPRSTTECRLLLRAGARRESYSYEDHERRMAGFNSLRSSRFYIEGDGVEYGGTYDAVAARLVWLQYHQWNRGISVSE
jgi:hypothetical protein